MKAVEGILAPEQDTSPGYSAEEQAVLDVIEIECAAFFANDYETLADQWLHAPDTIRLFAGPRVGVRQHKGWDEISKGFRKSMEWAPQNYDTREYLVRKNVQVTVSGDVAWVHYDQVLAKNDPGFIVERLQHETKILHRVGTRWKIACMILVVPEREHAKTPEIRLDATGRVVQLNDQAKARLPAYEGLKIVRDRLFARQKDMDAGLQAEIADRVAFLKTMFAPGLSNRSSHPIPLGEDENLKPMYCWARVVQSEISITFEDTAALDGWIEHASELFGLSPSQRRMVALLVDGQDLRAVADEMGVQVSTIKTQLRRVFEKTGTNSQTALMSRLMSVRKPG